jgi:hypothetical protein
VGRNGDDGLWWEGSGYQNIVAEANCRKKVNPKPNWPGSSSCLVYSSHDSALYSRLT